MTGGSKGKRGKNKPVAAIRKIDEIAKLPDMCQSYGVVLQPLGNKRFRVKCQSPEDPSTLIELNCPLKRSIRTTVEKDRYVLVQLFDFNHNQGWIIEQYTDSEVNALRKQGRWDFPKSQEVSCLSSAAPLLDLDSGDEGLELEMDSADDVDFVEPDAGIEDASATLLQAVMKADLPDDVDIDNI